MKKDPKDYEIRIHDSNDRQEVKANQRDTDVVFHSDESSIIIECGPAVTQIPRCWDISCPNCTVLKIRKAGFEYLNNTERRRITSVAIPLLIKRFPVCYKVKGPAIGGEPTSIGDGANIKVDFWTATRLDEPARMMSCALHTPRNPLDKDRVFSKFESDLANGPKHSKTYNSFIARNFRFLMWGGLGDKGFSALIAERASKSDELAELWLDANCYDIALKACRDNVEAKSRVVAWGTRHYDEIQEREMKNMNADISEWEQVMKTWQVFPNSDGTAGLVLHQNIETVTVPPKVGNCRISEILIHKDCVRTIRLCGYVGKLDMKTLADRGVTTIQLGCGTDIGKVRRDGRIKLEGSDEELENFNRFFTYS